MSWANMPASHFLQEAERLGPTVLAERVAIERDRALPPDLVQSMREAGFFSLWLPKSMGGPNCDSACKFDPLSGGIGVQN